MTTLYIKTHNTTGLKYFGKTTYEIGSREFDRYLGSGKYWMRHLKVHGKDITTEIYAVFDEITQRGELVETALRFSEDNNIVESKEWSNFRPENGLDGNPKGKGFENIQPKYGDKNGMYGNGSLVSGTKNGRHSDNYVGDISIVSEKISTKYHSKSEQEKKLIKEREAETKLQRNSNAIGAKKQSDTKSKWTDEKRSEVGKKYSNIQNQINSDPVRKKKKIDKLKATMDKKANENPFTLTLYDNIDNIVFSVKIMYKHNITEILDKYNLPKQFLKFINIPFIPVQSNMSSYITRAKNAGLFEFEGYILQFKKESNV